MTRMGSGRNDPSWDLIALSGRGIRKVKGAPLMSFEAMESFAALSMKASKKATPRESVEYKTITDFQSYIVKNPRIGCSWYNVEGEARKKFGNRF
mmetsp:Transcript_39615/g.74302  ORF Transcript_39615/g.74302 Transcript_39615/m.74302 type:complete len:95 (-) Transcript_39615:560-844(-)